MRNKLSSRMKDLEKENLNLRSQLEQYERCGPELTDLAVQYSKLQKEIEVRKWAREELSKKK